MSKQSCCRHLPVSAVRLSCVAIKWDVVFQPGRASPRLQRFILTAPTLGYSCPDCDRDTTEVFPAATIGTRRKHTLWSIPGFRRSAGGTVREHLKFFTRAIFNPNTSRRWLAAWNASPRLSELATLQPGVLRKVYRSYLFHGLTSAQRVDIILSHYHFVQNQGMWDLVIQAAQSRVQLAQFTGRSGAPYQISLEAVLCMEREGELVLQMISEDRALYSVAFTFVYNNGLPHIAVGCLQGGRDEGVAHQIRTVTKDLFGLRPKTMLMRVLRQIGVAFGCGSLVLVENANRVMRKQIRQKKVAANYDQSWNELGAKRLPDGNFSWSCALLEAPDLALIPSNKRAQSRRKYALLFEVANTVVTAMSVPNGALMANNDRGPSPSIGSPSHHYPTDA